MRCSLCALYVLAWISSSLVPGNLAAQTIYTPYTFATLAGTPQSMGSSDGSGPEAGFNWAEGVAVDATGNLFIADQNNFTVRKMTPTGDVTTLAGFAGTSGTDDGTGTNARFSQLGALALDRAGNVFVADTDNQTIRKVTPVGTNWVVTTIAGQAGFYGTNDGMNNQAQFHYPNGVVVDSNGVVYVGDSQNGTIRQLTPVGTNWVVTTPAGQPNRQGTNDGIGSQAFFQYPCGLALDGSGNLYVADLGACTIRKISLAPTNWVVSTLAGSPDNPDINDGTNYGARFYYPFALALDPAGNLLVTDSAQTIRRVTPAGVVTTAAGVPGTFGTNDGTGAGALFNSPAGIGIDPAGNVYVTDSANFTIRRGFPANATPQIMTFAADFGNHGGSFGFSLAGPAGVTAVVQASGDLTGWSPIWTNIIGAAALPFTDSGGGGQPARFFRAGKQ